MDDEKGILAALNSKLTDENKVKSPDDLHVGDIVYVELDKNDGLVLNGKYVTRLKYVVVAGAKSNAKEICVALINTSNDYSNDPDWKSEQYLLHQSDYPEILDYDSWLDCTDVKELLFRKIKSKDAIIKGRLNSNDLARVMITISESEFVSPHIKKVYGINRFVENNAL
ncbi:MAG: hypothetical protein J6T70_02750 [Bacteroidales bacterium]|nr:hypothetical protein [Bacteroidales bacterium]